MGSMILEGVQLQPLNIFSGINGQVLHGLKATESAFVSFGEVYFSTVQYKAIKGWKLHTKMVSNIVVPIGAIRFVLFDPRLNSSTKGQLMDVTLSPSNYQRLTIPTGLWFAFQGASAEQNMLMNIASIPHDPLESSTLPIDTPEIPFTQW